RPSATPSPAPAYEHDPALSPVGTQAPWSYSAIPVAAPRGSDALNAELDDGPVGDDANAPKAPPTPAPAPAPAPTPAPAGPTISSATVKAAPSGAANTRKKVGVGEQVDFTGSVAGAWKASDGTPSGPSATSFRWTAPATAATVTITLTPTAGAAVTDTIAVVPPDEIAMRKVASHTAQVGPGGACMLTEVTFKPLDVCLGAMQTLEVPEDGT